MRVIKRIYALGQVKVVYEDGNGRRRIIYKTVQKPGDA